MALGTVLTPSTNLVPKVVKRLMEEHPGVGVTITIDTSKLMTQRLRSGELDIMIGRILDSDSAAEFDLELMTDEPHSVIVRAGHPLLEKESLELKDLAGQPWILPPRGSILRDRLTALFLLTGLDQPIEAVESLALPVVAHLLMNTDLFSALPEELVQTYLDIGLLKVLPFDLGVRMDPYGIVTRKNHQLSPAATALLQILRVEMVTWRS